MDQSYLGAGQHDISFFEVHFAVSSRISVIMAAYNCERYMARAVQSILDQSHSNLEVLIADDGSSDRTKEIIDSFADSRIKTFHNLSNQGYPRTANKLLENATGEYICFQDSDDWSSSSRFERQLAFLQDAKLDACGTDIYYTSETGRLTERIRYPTNSQTILNNELSGIASASYGSILFSKAVYRDIGGYRQFFKYGAEDFDWFMRVIQKFRFNNLPEPHYFYRFSPSSITSSMSILKQKASLHLAREFAISRSKSCSDYLESGRVDLAERRWDELYHELGSYSLAEELNKINRLLRRHAYLEALKICVGILFKHVSVRDKVSVIGSTFIKLAIGMNRYQRIKQRISG